MIENYHILGDLMRNPWIKTLIVMLSISTISMVYADTVIYRYKDKEGKVTMTSTLPPEAANMGYEILNAQGIVVKVIAPPKSAEELAKEQQEQEKEQAHTKAVEAEKHAQAEQAKKDELLLKTFVNVDDIIRSRDEKIASIAVLEGIVHENLNRLQKQLQEANQSAQYYTSRKQPLPETLQKTIDQTQREITQNNEFLQNKAAEKKQIYTNYDMLIKRFKRIEDQEKK